MIISKENNSWLRLIKKFIIHAQVWLIFFVISYFVLKGDVFESRLSAKVMIWLIYIITFYVNYALLFRFFFYKKKYVVYLLTSLLLIFVSVVVVSKIRMDQFDKNKSMMVHDENIPGFGPPPGSPPGSPDDDFKPPPENDYDLAPPPEGDYDLAPPEDELGPKPDFGPNHEPPLRRHFPSLLNVLLIFTASISLRFYEKWQEQEQLQVEIEKEKIQTELLFLKQQINPHFLFNSLNNIYSLALSKSDFTTDAILKLSSILRYILYKSKESEIFLSEELAIIQDYIDLQKLRLNEKVELNYLVEGQSNHYKIESFILIPLVENCFKYGVDTHQKSKINIFIKIHHNALIFSSVNTIVHKKGHKEQEASGIGITNLKRRLDLLYPDNYKFTIQEQDKLFKVDLIINLKK